MAFSCAKHSEEEAPEVRPTGKLTSIEAYIVQPEDPEATKTTYETQGNKAVFSWLDGDHIDAVVTKGTSLSSVVFTKQIEDNLFQDGHVDGQATLAQRSGYSLGDWAFYPSRVSPEAQAGGFIADWSYEGGAFKMDLPASITRPSLLKPMSAVPLVGKKGTDGKYAFTQPVGVLAVPVKNLPMEADFISIHSESVALAGCFTLEEGSDGVLSIAARAAASDAEKTLTQHFSGLQGTHTFYFAVPYGVIPAGLVLTVGSSADEDFRMTKTTKRDMTVARGHIVKTPELTFEATDPQWQPFGTGTFKDDFMWTNNASWQVAPSSVAVTIEQSAVYPKRFRINNPYSVAWTQFGYTTSREGVTFDDYFVFMVEDDGTVSYSPLKSGFMDTYKSPAQPMLISNVGSETKVVQWQRNGDIYEIQFGALYSLYNPDDDTSWKYTKGNPAVLHLTVDVNDTWTKVVDGTFIDEKMWSLHGWGTERVPIELYQSEQIATHFRVPNPYLVAKDHFNYSTYTTGITGDTYLDFTIEDGDAVRFVTFNAGIEDKSSGGKAMKIWYPSDAGSFPTALAGNLVASYRSDGLPAEVELYPIYTGVDDTGYKYTDQGTNRVRMSFPEPENWNDVAMLYFMDDFWVHTIAGATAGQYVPVTLQQSTSNPKRFRIANPYPNLAQKAQVATDYQYPGADVDDYLVMTVDANDLVTFGDFRPGIGRTDWEFSFCDSDYWNTQSSTTQSTGYCRVVSYDAQGIPKFIDLHGVYHKIGEYNTGNRYSRATDQYSDRPYIAASFPLDSWTSLGTGRFKDKFVWGCAGLTDYATVEFQQNDNYPNKFRIAKPYPGTNSDEWFVFDVSNPDKVTYTSYYLDYEVTAEGKQTYKPYIGDFYSADNDYSKVLETQESGLPAVVELAACYRGDSFLPNYDYGYEIGRDHEMLAIEIIFPGCNAYYSMTITPYDFAIEKSYNYGNNPLAAMSYPAAGTLNKVVFKMSGVDLSKVDGLALWGPSGWMHNAYVAPDANGVVTIDSFSAPDFNGGIDINLKMNADAVGDVIRIDVQEVVVDGVSVEITQDKDYPYFPGIIVNTGGDVVNVRGSNVTVASFRIPALVTSNSGTLISAYDVRYDHAGDLQADIDVGVKRSTDGGKTWSPLIIAMDMGIYGYEAEVAAGTMTEKKAHQNNGIGDPCLLVDKNTGRIFCFALWAHGHEAGRILSWSSTGYDINDTGQFMMVYSDDDGVTWSDPINITRQIKKQDWKATFQGPGNGITMAGNGTLVIPMQHQENGVLNSGIAYSTDHGETWHTHNYAHATTSEACVAEVEPGVLLLSMRDETNSYRRRAFYTTDLGRTWKEHESNGLIYGDTCEASMIHSNSGENNLGQDITLLSNPVVVGRSRLTIHASVDHGKTYPYELVVDAAGSAYSCL